MFIYVLLTFFLAYVAIIANRFNERSKKIMYIACGVVLFFVVVLRNYEVSRDFSVYERLYGYAPSLSLLKQSFLDYYSECTSELSYSFLCTFLKSTGNSDTTNYIIIFTLYALLGVSAKLYGIKRLTNFEFYSLFIYSCNLFLLHEMTQIRAGVAIGIIFIALAELRDERKLNFCLWILLATFFHFSSLMVLVVLLFYKYRANSLFWSITFAVSMIVYFAKVDIFSAFGLIPVEYFQYKLKLYLEMQEKDPIKVNFFNIAFLIQNIIIIICFYYQKEIEKINSSVNILLNMACLSSCSYLLFTQIPAFSVRISEVFNCGLIILIPLITRAFKPKALAEALVVIIGFFFFYIYVFHSEIVRDYKFIWS